MEAADTVPPVGTGAGSAPSEVGTTLEVSVLALCAPLVTGGMPVVTPPPPSWVVGTGGQTQLSIEVCGSGMGIGPGPGCCEVCGSGTGPGPGCEVCGSGMGMGTGPGPPCCEVVGTGLGPPCSVVGIGPGPSWDVVGTTTVEVMVKFPCVVMLLLAVVEMMGTDSEVVVALPLTVEMTTGTDSEVWTADEVSVTLWPPEPSVDEETGSTWVEVSVDTEVVTPVTFAGGAGPPPP